MALISSFTRIEQDSTRVHGSVECGYRIFENEGRRYLQLDTYGSTDRAIPGKTSQTIQLDESAATELTRIIRAVFPQA
jgi:hypothetical protein